MNKKQIVSGFSKLSKTEKIQLIAQFMRDPDTVLGDFSSYWHSNEAIQKRFDEFSENTVTNYYMPYGIAPNFLINNKLYHVPMVIEESSVVAAASKSAKFWADRGGFKARVISTVKIGQVHFTWEGNKAKLQYIMPELKERLIRRTADLTDNMRKRGGGITNIELVDMTDKMPNYYQLKASFETQDAMGANFINSCLEEFAGELKLFLIQSPHFSGNEKECTVVMSILSNYTPQCIVECKVECPIPDLKGVDNDLTPHEFAAKFEKAVRIAQIDPHRATTHNKGIFNGIDAVVLATGNDFRAVEACGHTYASRNGRYSSLTDIKLDNNHFEYTLTVPMALGTVGGLTGLHPLVRRSLELLDNPSAPELMMIAAATGMANNFGALQSLTTKGIQVGHMKMHLLNILNHFNASEAEKQQAVEHFKTHKVSFSSVEDFVSSVRQKA